MAENLPNRATLRMAETIPPRSLSERYKEKPAEDDHEPEQRKDDVPAVTHYGLRGQMNAVQARRLG
jgi:hypothetical protein